MAEIKKINTDLQIEAGLLDGDGNSGTANQILISTGTGVDWVDGSGSSIIGGPYLPLAGGTMTGNLLLNDNVELRFGADSDLRIYHNGTNNFILNTVGNLNIRNTADDGNITFQSDDGSGGYTNYFIIDGGNKQTQVYEDFRFQDSVKAKFGNSSDLQIYHDGSDSYIKDAGTGDLRVVASATKIYDADMSHFQATFTDGGSVDLYYGGNKKFETTSTGVTVTGEGIFTGNVGIGTTSPFKNLNLEWSSSSVNPETGEGLSGGTSGKGVLLKNSNTTVGTFANLDFRANNVDARIAVTYNATNNGDFHFILDNTTATPQTRLLIEGETGNVGIGTTSPSDNLEIGTNGGSDTAFRMHSDQSGKYFRISSGGNFTQLRTTGDQNLFLDSSGTSGYITFSAGDSERMRVNYNGNVGIGTTSPGAKLDVSAGTNLNLGIRQLTLDNFSDEGIGMTFSRTSSDADLMAIGVASADKLGVFSRSGIIFSTGGLVQYAQTEERMRIDLDGNVGIGTTSPQDLLHLSADSPVLRLTNTVDTGQSSIEFWDNQSGTSQAGEVFYDDNSNLFGLQGNGNGIVFRANNTFPGSELMRLNGSGNLGIGTTSPFDSKLQVAGRIRAAGGTSGGYFFGSEEFDGGFYAPSDGNLAFSTNNTERIRIDGNGNVGIGTTGPLEPLSVFAGTNESVYDVLGVYNSVTGTSAVGKGAAIRIGKDVDGDYSTKIATIYEDNNPSFLQPAMAFFTMRDTYLKGSEVERMRISSGGNVGIGTTSPSAKLDVNGGSDNLLATFKSTDYLAYISFQDNNTTSNTSVALGANDNNLVFFTGTAFGSERMRITNAGNVGIGTTSPVNYSGYTTLQIDGSNGSVFRMDRDDNTVQFEQAVVSNSVYYKTITGTDIWFGTNNTERMRIDSAGKVSVGSPVFGQLGVRGTTDDSTAYSFEATNSSGNSLLIVRNDGQVWIPRSNVGIGTTSPAVQLELGDNTADEKLRLTGAASGKPLMTFYNTTTKIGQIASSSVGITVTSLGSGNMTFENGGNPRLVIDNSGNVGVGTTSPSYKLHVDSDVASGDVCFIHHDNPSQSSGTVMKIRSDAGDNSGSALLNIENNTGNALYVRGDRRVGIGTTSPSSKLHVKDTSLSGTLAYFEASASAQGTTNVRVDCLQYGTGIAFFRDGSLGGGACSFRNDSGTQVGSINIGTSSTLYSTSSDYRLKENLTLITDGIDRLKQLKPKRFNFIGETQIVDGFVAHEAKEVVPESVTGEKDEVLPNGDPVYQGIDQAKIVPLLTAALQEAVAKIEDLENRIQTLENK